jgi:excisionase family DNA binding protein
MKDIVDLPNISGYVSIKEAAQMLGLSHKTVYQYVAEGRLPGVRAGDIILIAVEAVKNFKPNLSGRPRTTIPLWRISPEENHLLSTLIHVQIRKGRQEALPKILEEIRHSKLHLFPGTVARYIISSESLPEEVQILLVWRSTVTPDETTREKALEEFRRGLADVLDWETAKYDSGTVLMHT